MNPTLNPSVASTEIAQSEAASSSFELSEARPFLGVAAVWMAGGAVFCLKASGGANGAAWMIGLSLLCLLDLFAMAKLFATIFALMGDDVLEKKATKTVQAFYWGLLKVTCVGIFIGILIRAEAIPTAGLLIGLGTLIAVPLLGGAFWASREVKPKVDVKDLRHA